MELRNDLIRFLLIWLPAVVLVLAIGAVLHVLAAHPHLFDTAVITGRALGGIAFVAMVGVVVGICWTTFRRR